MGVPLNVTDQIDKTGKGSACKPTRFPESGLFKALRNKGK